jgi:steroid 5-alpha reductase family enzyme
MPELLLLTLISTLCGTFVLWLVSLARRDASIIDGFWGIGFVVVAWLSFFRTDDDSVRLVLLLTLVAIWGLRLSLFLIWRNWGQGEDRRYAAMRKQHGRRFWWVSHFTVFLLQGLILWFVSLPLQCAAITSGKLPLGVFDGIGMLLWAIGLFFEAVGDWQLARFKAEPANAGKVMNRGLWQYTRHPNYFGDFCVWWGLYFIAASGGATWTIGSPLLMSLLLMKISGVTLLETTIAHRRPDYAEYQARTNAFFPGRPRS